MFCFLNGKFVPAEQATVSIADRGFLYGDGLFETMRVYDGKPFAWRLHWERLQRGARFLKMKSPLSGAKLEKAALELIRKNERPDSVLRLQLSRGVGARGYSTRGADKPTLLMTVHPLPENKKLSLPWKLVTSNVRLLAGDPLAAFKTCNKLPQIVARTEAEAKGADDALLLNHRGEVAETTSANLFWIQKGVVCSPRLECGILPGVTRSLVLSTCKKYKVPFVEQTITRAELFRAEGVFLTSSVMEIVEVSELDQQKFARSPLTQRLRQAYRELVGSGR